MTYDRGSQPFGTHVPPNRILPLCIPPNKNCTPFTYPQNQKFYQNKLVLSDFENLGYPL